MKRLFIIIISMFVASVMYGQVRCDAGDINIEMTFKRVVISGNEAIIDFTLTNFSKKDIKIDMDSERSRAYDDEGNCYLAHRFSFDMANTGTDGCILPPETPVRLRCFIKDIDEYATVFTRLEMSYFMNCYNYFSTSALKKMSVKNIEFTRD